jgi:anti-sigma factor RsiW
LLLSIALDDDLSPHEDAALRKHLRRCASCDAYGSELTAFTAALRVAPLEELPCPMAVPRRHRSRQPLIRAGAMAAAAVVVLGLGVTLVPVPDSSRRVPAAGISLPPASEAELIAESQNWSAGLPRVKLSDFPRPLGQRAVEPGF